MGVKHRGRGFRGFRVAGGCYLWCARSSEVSSLIELGFMTGGSTFSMGLPTIVLLETRSSSPNDPRTETLSRRTTKRIRVE